MEGKITLYDSNGTKMGETFIRRAKQLVKQQRAVWVDEKQDAVRFAPGQEHSGTDTPAQDDASAEETETPAHDDTLLITLAQKRLQDRGRFIFHTAAVVPVWFMTLFALAVLTGMNRLAQLMFMFFSGAWFAAYAIHLWAFAWPRFRKSNMRKERKARRLAMEVSNLRAELER
ncbi:MAG: hypothetical protein FWD98_00710 [Defluviitaleaceae bacterium]|nr:hypothetical protein [Defluviitaleaceae bacterium]